MKKFSFSWTELKNVVIEAKSRDEAWSIWQSVDYDEYNATSDIIDLPKIEEIEA